MIPTRLLRIAVLGLMVSAVFALATPASGTSANAVTVDFSSLPSGTFDPDTFRSSGIYFSGEWQISMVQGFNALSASNPPSSPVEGFFASPGVSGVSVSLAPSLQGTATYRLRAFSSTGEIVGQSERTITVDLGDPDNMGWGYWDVSLPTVSGPAVRFVLESLFVRSSYSNNFVPYGVRSITFTPVPSAQEQVADLIALVDSYNLGQLGAALHDKLVSVQTFLAANKTQRACNVLDRFLAQVKEQRGKRISVEQADRLTLDARRIKAVIGC
ncbi:MAG: FIMAH domain-containing protein [Gaiellaceae bacterium]